MRNFLIRILRALVIVAVAASFAHADDFMYFKKKAAAGGGGLSISVLTSGLTTTNPDNTASITPASGSVVYVAVAVAYNAAVNNIGVTVSGCGLTWVALDNVVYNPGGRRFIHVSKGTGSPSAGVLTITATSSAGTYQETMYSVVQVTGADGTTPNDAPVKPTSIATGTTLSTPDVGTPGSGDAVFVMLGMENATNNIALTGSINQLTKIENGGNIRSFIVGYEAGASPDETPGATWSTNASAGAIGFIINVAP